MSGPVVVSEQTAAELKAVTDFFGIDLEWNRHIFRFAAQADGNAFQVIIRALAVAINQDQRRGATGRIRANILATKGVGK
jgi:hypothetical protein